MDIPVLVANPYDLNNFVTFILLNEAQLTEYGALKIQTTAQCELALKKRKTSSVSVLVQRATQVHQSEPIYTIHKRDRNDLTSDSTALPIRNEKTFWYNLSCSNVKPLRSDVIISPNKSLFYEKWNRKYFTTYQLPRQSLLSIGNNSLVHQCVPTLAQAHGAGAIFPLAVARHGLPLFIYHHGGGARHWYLIRGQHKEALMQVLQQCIGAKCIQHDSLFVDPSVFEKNQIEYRHVVQYPNEILVLDAGVMTQSFTTDVHWSESIPFGLPTWIRNGHALAHQKLCCCDLHSYMASDSIDLSLFSEERISHFIEKQIEDYKKLKIHRLNNTTHIIQPNSISSSTDSPSPALSCSVASNAVSTYHEREYHSTTTTTTDESSLSEMLDYLTSEDTDFLDAIAPADQNCFDEYWLAPSQDVSQFTDFPDSNLPSISIGRESNFDYHLGSSSSCRPSDPDSESSIQILDDTSDQSSSSIQAKNASISHGKKRSSTTTIDEQNLSTVLFISGLKYTVTKSDLYKQFLGSVKIIIRSCRTTPHLKYAFIVHKAANQARRNLRRRIDYKRLGRECFIQYACHSSSSMDSYRVINERTICVTAIPQNVGKHELQSLFENGVIMKYCPARTSSRRKRPVFEFESEKLSNGIAFIVFHTEKEAADVIQNASKYYIKGQSLELSILNETEQL